MGADGGGGCGIGLELLALARCDAAGATEVSMLASPAAEGRPRFWGGSPGGRPARGGGGGLEKKAAMLDCVFSSRTAGSFALCERFCAPSTNAIALLMQR